MVLDHWSITCICNYCLYCNGTYKHCYVRPYQSFKWFFIQNFTDFFSIDERCDTLEGLLHKGCSGEFVEFPVSNVKVLKNQSLGKNAGHTNVSYIAPQKMHLHLRQGMKVGDTDFVNQRNVSPPTVSPLHLRYFPRMVGLETFSHLETKNRLQMNYVVSICYYGGIKFDLI